MARLVRSSSRGIRTNVIVLYFQLIFARDLFRVEVEHFHTTFNLFDPLYVEFLLLSTKLVPTLRHLAPVGRC